MKKYDLRKCSICGTEIPIEEVRKHPQKTLCSRKCAGIYKRTILIKICPTCGKRFRKNTQYCSMNCARPSFASNKGAKTGFFKNCEICEKPFFTVPSSSKQHTCSIKCMSIKMVRKRTIFCKHCGEQFERQLGKKSIFCSRKCAIQNRWKNHIKKQKPSDVIKRKEFKQCEICGYKNFHQILERHHLDTNHDNNSRENMVVLCPNCHDETHFKTKTGRFKWLKI